MAPRKKKFKSDDVSVAQNVAPADDANVDGSVTDDAIHEDCPENFLIEIEENRSAVLKAVKAHVIDSIFTFLNYNLADKAS